MGVDCANVIGYGHFRWDHRQQMNMYASRLGFWRTYIMTVIYKYLDCGDLHMGFARVRCEDCGHEYLLAFSCKRRQFCPSCHQKRVVEYGEWLLTNVLKNVPHRQWVFSIPKRLRIYFLYDRKLPAKLSVCAWKVINTYLNDAIPAAISNEMSSKEFRQNWARLIQKVYEVDPLLCPKCQGTMQIISFIEDLDIIEKILRHLELWDIRNHDPPKPEPSHIPELVYDYSDSQIPAVDYWN